MRRVTIIMLLGLTLSLFGVGTVVVPSLRAHVAHAQGNTYYANPGDNLTQKASILLPGDTLILNDGTYSNSSLTVQNINGTAAEPITITAANDGKAIIDGGGSTSVYPIKVGGGSGHTSYVTIQGLVAQNGEEPVAVWGSNVGGATDHITLERITAHGANINDNMHDFAIDYAASDITVQDSAGWGPARYIFETYQSNNVTFRRDWAEKPQTHWTAQAPRCGFSAYSSTNVTLENDIGTFVIPQSTDNDYYCGTWVTSDNPAATPTNNTKFIGDVFYNDCEGVAMATGGQATNTTYQNDVFDIPYNNTCASYMDGSYEPDAIAWGTSGAGTVTNDTFVNSNIALNDINAAPITLTNTIFATDTTALQNDPGHSYIDFFGNGTNGGTVGATDKTADPGFNYAKYGLGSYLFVPCTSPLHGAGQGGADIGANVLYESVNGQTTSTPLWPWPMESRILAETGTSPTYSSQGGIWNTLDGVYAGCGSPTPTNTPTATKTATPTVTNTATNTPTNTATATATVTPTCNSSNLVQNPSFETGFTPWVLNINAGMATQSQDNTTAEAGTYSEKVNVTTVGTSVWDIGVLQGNISLTSGVTYTVSFWAKASVANLPMLAVITQNYSPWGNESPANTYSLTTAWKQYSFTYQQATTDANTELQLDEGQTAGTYWIDNVSVTAACGSPTATPTATATATATNTPAAATATATNTPAAATATRTATAVPPTATATVTSTHAITTVFVIVEENHNWSEIKGSASAPYINNTLLPSSSYATQYYTPSGNHPSLPNYLWLEAGQCFTFCGTDNPPGLYPNGLSGTHLTTLLSNAGISWHVYAEGVTDNICPTSDSGEYATKHNANVYFNDVQNPASYCTAHVKSFGDLATDLANGTQARYNLIIPNLCDDGHDPCAPQNDPVAQTDQWLQTNVPTILSSSAYTNGGALFVTWDEGPNNSDGPIGMIVRSPSGKGGGYNNSITYTHSSMLRTLEEIFGVSPYLGGAATSNDLSDLFTSFP